MKIILIEPETSQNFLIKMRLERFFPGIEIVQFFFAGDFFEYFVRLSESSLPVLLITEQKVPLLELDSHLAGRRADLCENFPQILDWEENKGGETIASILRYELYPELPVIIHTFPNEVEKFPQAQKGDLTTYCEKEICSDLVYLIKAVTRILLSLVSTAG